jgi:hypothetical protein
MLFFYSGLKISESEYGRAMKVSKALSVTLPQHVAYQSHKETKKLFAHPTEVHPHKRS